MGKLKVALAPLLIFLFCTLIGYVLSYLIFFGVDGELKLNKIVSKAVLILLVISIYPTMRWLKYSKEDIGFNARSIFIKQLGQGFVIGLLTLIPVLITLYVLEINVLKESADWSVLVVLKRLVVAIFLAFLISLAEEPLFRGVLLTSMAKKIGLWAGIGISSLCYAALHFIKPKIVIPYQQVGFFNSFERLGIDAINNLFNVDILPAFAALFMVGSFLAIIRQRMGLGMGICIGCHAAWVMQIKMSKRYFQANLDSDWVWLTSPYDGIIGPLVAFWMFFLIALYLLYSRQNKGVNP
jgi:membrane protease YdiL (CAAX protease family)